jgi:large subunit ribosomal protein L22
VPQVTEERELIRAQARYVRSSARKARLVLEHIRGKSAVEAQAILAFQTRAVARDAGKVLKSAIANAEMNNGHDADELVVVTAYADEGPTLKRWRARARGRVNRIRKRTCHITITVSPALPGEIKPRPERRPQAAAQPEPVEEQPKRTRSRSRKPAAEVAAAEATAEEIAAGEAQAEEQVVAEDASADSPDAEPAEPEAAEETDAPEEEPAAADEPAADEQPEAEAAAEEESTDDESKEADS